MCPECESYDVEEIAYSEEEPNSYFTYPQEVTIYKCNNCGFEWVD